MSKQTKNPMAQPKLVKIIVNMGTGDSFQSKETLQKLADDLAVITGQIPRKRPARVSVAGFGIRAGVPVGLSVTLRGQRMRDFFKKLVSVVLPRLKDFKGVSLKSLDRQANYTLGIREHTVFPEIDLSKVAKPASLEVTIVTSTRDRVQAQSLFEKLGMPFEKQT